KGFKLLVDFTLVDHMELTVQASVAKVMDFFNKKGVAQVIRVIPTPDQDFGFSILSLYHYSHDIKSTTVPSRKEADHLLRESSASAPDFKDAVILITGANRGIGRALAETALEQGAKKVYAAARN